MPCSTSLPTSILNRAAIYTSAVCFLVAGGFLLAGPWTAPRSVTATAPAQLRLVGLTDATPARPSKAIQHIRVGDRVEAGNPEAAGSTEAEVDPTTWRRVALFLPKNDGTRFDCDIVLLRPQAWLDEFDVTEGRTVDLGRMPELESVGPALVRSIGPCPLIEPGRGRIVTGTFTHDSDSILDLGLEGTSDVVGVTATHPIFSRDRQRFVAASELTVGERLSPLSGEIRVKSVTYRPVIARVYNLEVNVEHAFRVADAGFLVHNNCPKPPPGQTAIAP